MGGTDSEAAEDDDASEVAGDEPGDEAVDDVTDGALLEDDADTDSDEVTRDADQDEVTRDAGSDVDEAELELTDDDLGSGNDLFDGVDDSTPSSGLTGDDDAGGEADTADGDAGDGEVADGLSGNSESMEAAINDGAARMACIGLTDDDFQDSDLTKSGLEAEFRETFQAFRLGYYGSRAVDEYVLAPDDDEVSPAWGLAGSMLMAVAMAVWLRPDGAERVQDAREAVEGVINGGGDT